MNNEILLIEMLEKLCKAFEETMELEYGSKTQVPEVDEARELINKIKNEAV